ncbi:hypothetical protein ACHAXT_006241 [Thalassiosira profunda]
MMPSPVVCASMSLLIVGAGISYAHGYTSESMPGRANRPFIDTADDRPLAPPFPNGECGGSVLTLPQRDLFPVNEEGSSFFNLNLNPFSSLDNAVLPPRDIKVWLPPVYNAPEYSDRQFPVLYCHDGQNAMDDASSWTGSSWRLIGALTRLSERNLLHDIPIVVMLPCAEGGFPPRRHIEYGDITHPVSQRHGEFVAKTLHPYILDRFRVKEGAEHTASIGSSMGGQASMLLLLRYPELFGGAACLSPCFQPGTIAAVMAKIAGVSDDMISGQNIAAVFEDLMGGRSNAAARSNADTTSLHSARIYIDNGGDHDDERVPVFDAHDHFTLNERWWNPGYWWLDSQLQPTIDAMRWTLDQGKVDYTYEKFPGGRHNERGWAQRIHRPLLALYGKHL